MKRIGRRLVLAFTPQSNIIITKLCSNYYNLDTKSGLIQDVLDFDGELVYRTAGNMSPAAYGKDVNTLVSDSEYWFTEEELKNL